MFGTEKYTINLFKRIEEKKKEIDIESLVEEIELEPVEEVTIDHSRYIRSHGKRPRNFSSGTLMFTNKPFGEVDTKNPKEFHEVKHGDDHKKSVKAWAKEHGHHRVYTMESNIFEENELDHIDSDLEEGYKIGDMVNITNPKSKPQHKIIGKTKTHYHIEKSNGDKVHFPKERIARVNKERFDRLKAEVFPKRLKGEDIPKRLTKEEVESIEKILASLDETFKLDVSKEHIDMYHKDPNKLYKEHPKSYDEVHMTHSHNFNKGLKHVKNAIKKDGHHNNINDHIHNAIVKYNLKMGTGDYLHKYATK